MCSIKASSSELTAVCGSQSHGGNGSSQTRVVSRNSKEQGLPFRRSKTQRKVRELHTGKVRDTLVRNAEWVCGKVR